MSIRLNSSLIHFADCAFRCDGPSVWNSLNSYIVVRRAGTKNKLEGQMVEAPKASRGGLWGWGVPLPIRLGLEERRKLTQRGPGQNPSAKRI